MVFKRITTVSFLVLSFLTASLGLFAQGSHAPHGAEHQNSSADSAHTNISPQAHTGSAHGADTHGTSGCGFHMPEEKGFNVGETILNHIANANEYHLFGKVSIPLPCILYSKEDGIKTFMSSKYHHGSVAVDRYVSDHGTNKRIIGDFPMGEVHLNPIHGDHYIYHDSLKNGFICYNNKAYPLEKAQGLLAPTSFYDFSITKNVFTMLFSGFLLLFFFTRAARAYKAKPLSAPSGSQNFLEVFVQFITDEVAKPMIGDKYLKFLPYLLAIFFFILTNNLIGLIPIAPFGANVTGNIATTAALALIAFIVTNVNGKADYWKHIFWMPGVPVPMKIFLAPIELLGVFTKPISLMIRLFANITAGHIIILALVSLIFVFGKSGENLTGGIVGVVVGGLFTLFLSIIEVIVAFIQAFIFTILTASYIGGAVEEHHHEDAHH
jgi:F-type H+-transporting ATPase subunit a